MRDVNRIPILLDALKELWMSEQEQDLRFGQLVQILKYKVSTKGIIVDTFNIEDDIWLDSIKELIENKKNFKIDKK